jgi:hypothetical protein
VDLVIADYQLPETHPLPRGGTDLIAKLDDIPRNKNLAHT